MLFPWGNQRRFNSYISYCQQTYGSRLQKLSIDAGFSCPNRDGTKGIGGCTYCVNDAFNPSYCQPGKSVTQQINEGIPFHRTRYKRAGGFIAYFQAYSNTYASIADLRKRYEEAIVHPEITGLSIGTRPDCLSQDVLDLLVEINKQKSVAVEIGVESCYDTSLDRICRGHSFAEAVDAITRTSKTGLHTAAHFIFGLPGETIDDMLKMAGIISDLPLNSVKFHQLQIIKGTAMEQEFADKPQDFVTFTLEAYIDFIVDFLERFNPAIMIERLSGEVPPRFLAGPSWGLIRNDQVLQRIEKRLAERESWQGRLFQDHASSVVLS